jgi:uncharacterized protein (UPF0276 family)
MAGIGLRPAHHALVLRERPKAAWLEVQAENFMTRGALRTDVELIARHYPLSIHAAGLSLGSIDLPETEYLGQLRQLIEQLQPDLVSAHLSWSAIDGSHFPDLGPLPYTGEALDVVIRNVLHIQTYLRRPLLLENPSTCPRPPRSAMSEAEFLAEVTLRTGCGVLLDLNNLFVSASNLGSDPGEMFQHFLEAIPPETICEIHLAGQVCPAVWNLYARAIQELGPIPTLIEWDTSIAPFQTLQEEASAAQALMDENTDRLDK